MRVLTTTFSVSILSFVLTACSPMRFSQYSGSRRFGPVQPESMAETSFSLPVYRSWPDRPYETIGSLRFEDPNKYWDDGVIAAAVSGAKSKGGDAIIIRYGSEFGVSGLVGFGDDPALLRQNQTTALVIKWKPKSVVEAEAAALRAFKQSFQAEHPGLCKNATLLSTAIDSLKWTGASLDSVAADKITGWLTEIGESNHGELSGKWLYRCNFKRSQLTSAHSDFFYGMGLVALKDNVLTAVSTSGPTEVNFSGTFDKGRVTGKMGIAAMSISCDGVASSEKISLSGQGQVADGTFQASLVFFR